MTMKNLTLLSIVALLLFMTSCKKDAVEPSCENSRVCINAKLLYGGQPLALFSDVDYPQGFKIKVTRADFMLSKLKFSGITDALIYKDSAVLVSFTETDPIKAKDGLNIIFDDCKGNFNNLTMGIGVDSLLNSKNPSDFASQDILSNAFYYWDAWKSYIFLKIEGKYDADADGNFEGTFVYHIGTNPLYKVLNLPLSFNAVSGADNTKVVYFDVKKILTNGSDFIDMVKYPTSHNPGDLAIAGKIFDNLPTAIGF